MEIKVTLTQLNTPTHQGKVWWDGVPSVRKIKEKEVLA